jgi:hypothetical protein
VSSLGLLFNLIIGIVFTIVIAIAIPCPRVFYCGRRKRRVDLWLRGHKTHRRAYFALTLLQVRKHLAHLLVRLVDKGIVGVAHGEMRVLRPFTTMFCFLSRQVAALEDSGAAEGTCLRAGGA